MIREELMGYHNNNNNNNNNNNRLCCAQQLLKCHRPCPEHKWWAMLKLQNIHHVERDNTFSISQQFLMFL